MKGSSALICTITAVLVLLGAYALGLGIRTLRVQRAQSELSSQVHPRKSEPQAPVATGTLKTAKLTEQDEDLMLWLDEEMVKTQEAEVPAELETAEKAAEEVESSNANL